MNKYRRIQELLDERLGPPIIVRESNSEIVWRMWDDAVEALSDGKPRPSDGNRGGYPLNAFIPGDELK
jgi:hypothetical protein